MIPVVQLYPCTIVHYKSRVPKSSVELFKSLCQTSSWVAICYSCKQTLHFNFLNYSENAIKDCSKSKSVVTRKNKSLEHNNIPSDSHSAADMTAEIVVPVALATVATVLLLLAVFVFRAKIKNWLYKSSSPSSSEVYGERNGAPSISSVYSDNTKLFDIYVSYSVR